MTKTEQNLCLRSPSHFYRLEPHPLFVAECKSSLREPKPTNGSNEVKLSGISSNTERLSSVFSMAFSLTRTMRTCSSHSAQLTTGDMAYLSRTPLRLPFGFAKQPNKAVSRHSFIWV